ncbi:MAG: CHAT domain-containing protein, partial [Bacteroidota bacterium]
DLATLELINETLNQVLRLIEMIKKEVNFSASRNLVFANYYYLYEKSISNKLNIFSTLSNNIYLKEAFEIVERNKNINILEALRTGKATQFAGIPENLLQKEIQLREAITEAREERFEVGEDTDENQESLTSSLDSEIFDLQQSYDRLIDLFEKEYPNYYQLKYANRQIDVPTIQETLLTEQQTLLEYFAGDNSIYCFLIRRDTLIVKEIQNAKVIYDQIIQLRDLIDHRPFPSYEEYGGDEVLVNISHHLYRELLLPLADELSSELIIIPDGKLAYIPFEALLTSLPEEAHRYRSHPYLIRQHQVSYGTSATLLNELRVTPKQTGAKQLLAVAPAFTSEEVDELAVRSEQLGPLKFNIPEAQQICEITDGDLLAGQSATANAFQEQANNFRLLHLATHAKANDKRGDYSFLAFAGEEATERLYASDIYNLELSADMVVLSACETGVGELIRGEGFISLARAFTYAGARSLVHSLWRVNDNTTSELMFTFYENLKLGQTKSRALHQAKLDYLSQQKDRAAHPFYWAAFVLYGNMEAVEWSSESSFFYPWGILVLVGVLLGFLGLRKSY